MELTHDLKMRFREAFAARINEFERAEGAAGFRILTHLQSETLDSFPEEEREAMEAQPPGVTFGTQTTAAAVVDGKLVITITFAQPLNEPKDEEGTAHECEA